MLGSKEKHFGDWLHGHPQSSMTAEENRERQGGEDTEQTECESLGKRADLTESLRKRNVCAHLCIVQG